MTRAMLTSLTLLALAASAHAAPAKDDKTPHDRNSRGLAGNIAE